MVSAAQFTVDRKYDFFRINIEVKLETLPPCMGVVLESVKPQLKQKKKKINSEINELNLELNLACSRRLGEKKEIVLLVTANERQDKVHQFQYWLGQRVVKIA